VLHDEDLGQAIIESRPRARPPHTTRWSSIRTLHLKLDDALKDELGQGNNKP
jgi:hypothetical protein